MSKFAALVLEDGSVFHGESIGAEGSTVGEVVFNTSMTGYQEIITDPSYAQQIVTFTYPHIGNVGINLEDHESKKIWVQGIVVRNYCDYPSNWRSRQTLAEFLKQHSIVAISEIDTRRLTRIIREKGAQRSCITTDVDHLDDALRKAQGFAGLNDMDLAKEVSVTQAYEWRESSWTLEQGIQTIGGKNLPYHVVVYDYGVKTNILRLLVDRGCRLTVVPAQTPAADVLAMKPHGIVLSNGPGDPAACDYAIAATRSFLEKNIPLYGICLGHQLLALAAGAKTMKLKFGHHGANHPVQDIRTGQVFITSQNHGFAVDESTLPAEIEITHRSLFDQTIQGIRHKNKPAFSFQGHPEASPGPHDMSNLFNEFIALMR